MITTMRCEIKMRNALKINELMFCHLKYIEYLCITKYNI